MKKLQGFEIVEDFHPKHTLECGQIFRFSVFENEVYEVRTGKVRARIHKTPNGFFVETVNSEFFRKFFDLKTDYSFIKKELGKHKEIATGIAHGHGIRILKSPLFEMIVSFIISANNNIKKIQKTIEKLCELAGEKVQDEFGEFFAFPTLSQLKQLSEKEFYGVGAGYRSSLLVKAIAVISDAWLEQLETLPTEEARSELIKLAGVGGKVADCVLLFGLSRKNVFPVDVWVERVFQQHYGRRNQAILKREDIRKFFVEKFGDLSGFAQQFLFYSIREEKGKQKPYRRAEAN